ncbi:MAG: hypothetical protein IT567_07330 [Alphaproteobacteria bacterium]|nr:hypothetical protein [Alphaproteobacteria bacterium]
MEGLETLIDLHQNELDRMRRQMVELETQRDKFQMALDALAEELTQEKRLADRELSVRNYLENYVAENSRRATMIRGAKERVQGQIDRLQQQIFDKFGELKKYEIAKEQADLRAAKERAHREQTELDEIAIDQFKRKESN